MVAVLIFGIFCTGAFAKDVFRRPLPLRAFGPRVLRWKTLARFLSSAPLRVRIPLRWAQTKTVPFRGPFPIQWWAMRDVRVRLRRPHPLRRSAPRVLRWKTLRVSSAPHPVGFESLCEVPKQKRPPFENRYQTNGGR